MQWSEMVAGGGLLLFFIILAAIAGIVIVRARKLDHEERRLMIEKGMTPPPRFSGGWPQVRQQENQLRFEERRLLIEKGLSPLDLPEHGKWVRDDYLRNGLITFFSGIGLGITYYLLGENAEFHGLLAFLGPVLALFGLGCVAYYFVSTRRSAGAAPK